MEIPKDRSFEIENPQPRIRVSKRPEALNTIAPKIKEANACANGGICKTTLEKTQYIVSSIVENIIQCPEIMATESDEEGTIDVREASRVVYAARLTK